MVGWDGDAKDLRPAGLERVGAQTMVVLFDSSWLCFSLLRFDVLCADRALRSDGLAGCVPVQVIVGLRIASYSQLQCDAQEKLYALCFLDSSARLRFASTLFSALALFLPGPGFLPLSIPTHIHTHTRTAHTASQARPRRPRSIPLPDQRQPRLLPRRHRRSLHHLPRRPRSLVHLPSRMRPLWRRGRCRSA
ncbi:hypothetical protein BDW22DRAFT_122478 [Trametopsis cervina]|nr:hypothetical protein BDW22DRAFT_122478 [Trametopsis cervina]